jgi:2-oxo-4-hydroxy-4-carboxy-5-ureidoimidazoline decarboxylase
VTLDEFNAADVDAARDLLRACLDIETWVQDVESGRPYEDLDALTARATASSAHVSWDQVAGALARHPRIGERPKQDRGQERSWSSAEQAGVQDSDTDALALGNRDYENRFGHIFLICAGGLSGEQMLAALHRRLTNDDETERTEVIGELRKIADLRLTKAITH